MNCSGCSTRRIIDGALYCKKLKRWLNDKNAGNLQKACGRKGDDRE